jgi:hypothetical protein
MASDKVIINAAIGGNYAKGQERLAKSLNAVGYHGLFARYKMYPVVGYDTSNPYTIKPSCFEDVLPRGPRFVIWMDASVIALRDLAPLFAHIEQHGYYLASSGYNAAQTCTDRQLEAIGIDRTQAEAIPDTATGCIGIDTHNERAMTFLREWIEWGKVGLFAGNRLHDHKDSQDPRFLHARQDQSAATLLAWKHGMKLEHLGGLTAYHPAPSSAVIAYKGIE